ncbi:MAG: hypothetical protein DSZ05_03740 [Sulfurospirillum sp.]|nr:MAG: hypothetical protein DSZ05_03740 [Sulfurospirillum sp.]
MLKIAVVLFWASIALFAQNILSPVLQIEVNGTAKDLTLHKNHLVIGTDTGRLQVYDYISKKFVKEVKIPDIKDFTGETVPAAVFSADYCEGRYLLLSDSGEGGYSNLWLHENNQTTQLISPKDKKPLIKARFVDKDHIMLSYLSNEAALYEISSKKELYREQLTPSKFSDFALNEDHTKAAFGCESGVISVIDVKNGKLIKNLEGINKDNVYKVDIKKDIVVGAGQDRRGSIYNLKTGKGDFIQGSFLIYATALSPDADNVAFSMDEQNNISVYKVATKEKIATLHGQKSTLNAIVFKDETTLFSASDDSTVLMWKLN